MDRNSTGEEIINNYTGRITDDSYKNGSITYKFNNGFTTGNVTIDALTDLGNGLTSGSANLDSVNMAATNGALIWKSNLDLTRNLDDLKNHLNALDHTPLSANELEDIKSTSEEAYSKGVRRELNDPITIVSHRQ